MEQLREMYGHADHAGNHPGLDDAPVAITAPHCEAQHIASTSGLAVADAANERSAYTGSTERIMSVPKSLKLNRDNEHGC
jgi:hypothetical protein